MKPFLIPALALLPLLAACNTIQGIGEDITAGGKALNNAINPTPAEDRNQRPAGPTPPVDTIAPHY